MADMKAVTERLRDTVNAEKRVEGERGHEAGTRWARQAATYSELVYLAYDFIEDAETFDSEHSLVDFMSREDGEHYEFVVVVAGDPYWKGFIAGAEKIWEAVASDLEPLYGRS
ncbi:MAG: hypothetical protein JWN52_4551 [Actinomycetia bacterium]|nr:hypothetical protein [Actinomycetes bacterium]